MPRLAGSQIEFHDRLLKIYNRYVRSGQNINISIIPSLARISGYFYTTRAFGQSSLVRSREPVKNVTKDSFKNMQQQYTHDGVGKFERGLSHTLSTKQENMIHYILWTARREGNRDFSFRG